jgi:hypothetical protein
MRTMTVCRLLAPCVTALMLALPSTVLAAPPANNDFANATPIALDDVDDPAGRTNVEATEQAGELLTPQGAGFCNDGVVDDDQGVDMTDTVWYRVTGNGRPITLDTRGSAIDTVMAVYDGVTELFIRCNDDIRPAGDTPDRDSELTFSSVSGHPYLVQIGACNACSPGAISEGRVDFVPFSAPSNDARSAAVPLTNGRPSAARNWGGTTTDAGERVLCSGAPFSRTVWFRFRAPGNGTAVFTANGDFDTVLAVYRGTTFVNCNDDGIANVVGPSRLTTRVSAGDYFLQVGGYGRAPDADYGSFGATADFRTDPPPPVPDRDGDGIADSADKCPDQSSSARDADRDGCLDPDPDPDRDGVPIGADKCPTRSAAGRDKNRDGCLDPAPRKRISADARLRATPTASGLRIVYLRVIAPKGSKVMVRCGPGCKFAKKAAASGNVLAMASKTVPVRKLAGRTFRAGQRIRIYVTRKGRIGAYIQYTITRGGFKRVNRCLKAGSTKPRKRCQ